MIGENVRSWWLDIEGSKRSKVMKGKKMHYKIFYICLNCDCRERAEVLTQAEQEVLCKNCNYLSSLGELIRKNRLLVARPIDRKSDPYVFADRGRF